MRKIGLMCGLAMMVIGCGSGGEPLTAESYNEVCEATAAEISDEALLTLSCYTEAIFRNLFDPESCEADASECIEAGDSGFLTPSCEQTDLPACAAEVTVAAWSACASANVDALNNGLDQMSCSDLAVELPPECESVARVCPELLDY